MNSKRSSGFTIVELLVAAVIFSVLAGTLTGFLVISSRLISRNLATNHSHETTRTAAQRMLADLHASGSPFALIDCSGPAGTTFTQLNASITPDRDPLSQQYISTRANGVRFRHLIGGPVKLAAPAAFSDTALSFDFGVNGQLPYVPEVGDKVLLPLLSENYTITAIPVTPTVGNTIGRIRLNKEVGFTLSTAPNEITTGYFFRLAAYTVFNNELRFHSDFQGAQAAVYHVVHHDVTSPKPFALMYPLSDSPSTDGRGLRVSLEAYDLKRSAQKIQNGTSTLRLIIPPRTLPTLLSSTD
jgi:prepilin-type N-terminal cleavage/methylation domain-containing protein